MLKYTSSDQPITDRMIYNEIKSTADLLIKRETDKRKLFQSANLFTFLPCIEMIKVPLSECCDYVSPKNIARSKYKIPKIAEGNLGSLVQQVTDVENGKKFVEVTPHRYANLLALGVKNKIYFWRLNDYLYISQEDTERVNLFAYFEEELTDDLLFPDCDCSYTTHTEKCTPIPERELKVPGYLIENVKSMVYDKFLKAYSQLPEDRTSNNKDETSK